MPEIFLSSDNAIRESKDDFLEFQRYVDPLVSLLTNPLIETPFTVGVFGTWGSGKTSLLRLLDAKLREDCPNQFLRVWFNPWVHRSEPNLLVPLLHTLHDTLDETPGNKFKESAKKLFNVLVTLGAGTFVKHITASAVTLEEMEKIETKYLETHGRVESQLRKLRRTLQAEVTKLHEEEGIRVVLFIDDLDRCDPAQIIDLLEAVKIFFDLEHLFIILAVDKEVVDRGIQIKYKNFAFSDGRTAAIGAEYLEKMVQLPLNLFPLHRRQVKDFIARFDAPNSAHPHLALLCDVLDPNPRKVKRALNILKVIATIKAGTPALHGLDDDLLTRLTVLQVQRGEMFTELVREPDLLLALESVYAGNVRVDDDAAFGLNYGDRAKGVQTFCKKYYRPGNDLGLLLKGEPFKPQAAHLSIYLAMFGGDQ